MSNVDSAEIANFQKLASEWWDPKGPMRALHHINPTRLAYIQKAAAGLQGKAVLDLGCGGGVLTEALAKAGATVTGIDLADDVLAAASQHAETAGLDVQYRCISAEALAAEAPAQFDVICCMEMLEHVPDPQSILCAIAALAKPGATVVLSTINRKPKAFALAVVGAEYLLNLVPKGTHEYAKFIKPSELMRWSQAAGLEVLEVKGMSYNPLTQKAQLGQDLDINYLMLCRNPL